MNDQERADALRQMSFDRWKERALSAERMADSALSEEAP